MGKAEGLHNTGEIMHMTLFSGFVMIGILLLHRRSFSRLEMIVYVSAMNDKNEVLPGIDYVDLA